jgi:YHS domain-containing protein
MFTRLLLCLLLVAPLGLSATDVKPYPLTTCIVSGDKLDPSVPAVVHNGQQVKFCCKSCVKKFQANPAKYLIKLPKK